MADSPSRPSRTADSGSSPRLEIAHVLFTDIVGYSKLPMDEQEHLLMQFQDTVRQTAEFIRAQADDQLIRLPTGDGMALVFFGDAEAPVRCAVEIGRSLRHQPALQLRMGIHTGPVYRVADINANRNVAGGGINIAQRVMDCGDAGHILVSSAEADVLCQVSAWCGTLHDLGEIEVKHGVRVHIYNLYTEEAGNAELPKKISGAQAKSATAAIAAKNKKFSTLMIAGIAVLTIASVGGWLRYTRKADALSATDTIVLADFTNTTGDVVFDDTLKQALSVSLRQSPFLNVLSESKVSTTLQQMTRPVSAPLTPDVAREVCQRTASKAYIGGSIASLGNEFVLGLKAVSCQNGDGLAQEQLMAASKEKVLAALGEAATTLRGKLGESLVSVQKFDVPLEQATTSSLEALKAYTLGRKSQREKGSSAALPFFQRATELDPNFASAYLGIGIMYSNMAQTARAKEYMTKAFQLRDRESELEKLHIASVYHQIVTGDLEKAAETYEEWIANYPKTYGAYSNLANAYANEGRYQKAEELSRRAMQLEPNALPVYNNLGTNLLCLNRFAEARKTLEEALSRNLDDDALHQLLFGISFAEGDAQRMTKEAAWFDGKPEFEHEIFAAESDAEAYSGHLDRARGLTRRARESAVRAGNKETAALWQANGALREAAFGNTLASRREAAAALALAPESFFVESETALAYALAGDQAHAQMVSSDLSKRFPQNTLVQSVVLPTSRALVQIEHKDPEQSIEILQTAQPYELSFSILSGCLYPVYVRGQAYLAAQQGSAAATEFQKIIDHPGIVQGCPTRALAHLGLARAYKLEAKSAQGQDAENYKLKARAAYQDFLTLWKDADTDIPVLKEAKAEYAKLQ